MLKPHEVTRELHPGGAFTDNPTFDFSVTGDNPLDGELVPLRGAILTILFKQRGSPRPYKVWLTAENNKEKGWLVVEDSGWTFYHQEHK